MFLDPSIIIALILTGSSLSGQHINLEGFTSLEIFHARGVGFTQLYIPNDCASIVSIDVSENPIEKLPSFRSASNIKDCNFRNCGMDLLRVTDILVELDASGSTSINCDLTGNAAPGPDGLAAIANIEARGGKVQHE